MKKILVSIIFLTFLLNLCSAQVGIKAGVNLATLVFENEEESFENLSDNSVTGFLAGVFFPIPISDNFELQPELLFIQKGNKSSYDLSLLSQKVESRTFYNYVELPVIAKFIFGPEIARIYVSGGGFAGLSINGKQELETTNTTTNTTTESVRDFDFSDEDERKRLNYGASLGAGAKLGKIVVDLRYTIGLNNLLDNDANNNNDNNLQLMTRGLAASIGIQF